MKTSLLPTCCKPELIPPHVDHVWPRNQREAATGAHSFPLVSYLEFAYKALKFVSRAAAHKSAQS